MRNLPAVTLLDALDSSREDFVWKDGERLIAFGGSALASLPGFLRAARMEQYALLASDRALEQRGEINALYRVHALRHSGSGPRP